MLRKSENPLPTRYNEAPASFSLRLLTVNSRCRVILRSTPWDAATTRGGGKVMNYARTMLAAQNGIETLGRWDAAALAAAARLERDGLSSAARALTRAGDTPGWIVHCLILVALLKIDLRVIAVMAAAAVLATASSQIAKRIFRRSRPAATIPGFKARNPDPDPFSFPSGHSTVAAAIATAAIAASPVLGGVEAVLAALIAGSRIYLGAHYPADVLGGIALGFACGLTAWKLIG
jgi:membrane-associated phospholipid phosphatase